MINNRAKIISIALLALHLSWSSRAQLAADSGKYLGNIAGSSVFSGFMSLWNQITPENGGKWGSVEATRDRMSWGNMDMAYNYSRNQGIPIRFHTLVWGQQQPSWIASLTPEEQKAQVEEWFRLTAARYPGLDMIDVVNEPLLSHAPAGYRAALGGSGATGWDWVIWCFEKAREHFPKAKLHINDYGILGSGTNAREYAGIIRILKERGLIDGIGCQGHFLETTPASIIRSNLATLTALDLPIYITEFDLNIADDTQQLNKYKEIFPVLWEHPAVKGITLWGYRQGSIWRENAYLIRSNGTERPALTWLRSYFSSSGTDPAARPLVSVSPNPATDFLRINGAQGAFLEITDLAGSILCRREMVATGEGIPLTSFPRGLLFIRISKEGCQEVFKILRR